MPQWLHKALTDEVQRRKYTPRKITVDKAFQEAVRGWLESPPDEGEESIVRAPTNEGITPSTEDVIKLQGIGTGKRSKVEPGDAQWLEMLAFILSSGDAATRDAITRNIERFHYLTVLLRGAPGESDPENAGPAQIPKDHEGRMDLVREIASRHGIDTEGLRGNAGGSEPEKGKHPRPTGTRGKH